MSKYIDMFNENKKSEKHENIIGSLSIMNAYTLTLSDEQIKTEKDDFLEFYDYFIENYGEDDELLDKMLENWFGDLPRVLRIAEVLLEDEMAEYLKECYKSLNNMTRKNVDILTNYIWNIRENRAIIICTGEEHMFVELPKYIPRKNLDFNKEWLRGHLALAFKSKNAGIVFRQVRENKKDIVMGFNITHSKISKLNKRNLKLNMELQPDGTMKNFDNEQEYEEATCKFI